MARKLKHSSSRKTKHTKGRKTHRRHSARRHTRRHHTARRNRNRHGGALGAPVGYHLSGSWPSQMSLGQGGDYLKYHEGQHGGVAPISTIGADALPAALRGPAHIGGIDKAFDDVRGLTDGPVLPQNVKTGGRRNKSKNGGSRRNKNKSKNGGSRRNKNKSKNGGSRHNKSKSKNGGSRRNKSKRGGAALGYAPFPSSGMLLSSQTQYAQAGLNPQWKTDVAFTDAKIRDTQ